MLTTQASLLQRLHSPNADKAWSILVELYTPLLMHWAHRVGLRQPDDADFVQDVFTVLARELPAFQYNPALGFRKWLRTVTMNLWRDRQKRRRPPLLLGDGPLEAATAEDDISILIDREHDARLVQRALEVMKADFQPATWQACWQLVVEGRTGEEASANLNMTVGAVHAAKFRVLLRLREELEGLLE